MDIVLPYGLVIIVNQIDLLERSAAQEPQSGASTNNNKIAEDVGKIQVTPRKCREVLEGDAHLEVGNVLRSPESCTEHKSPSIPKNKEGTKFPTPGREPQIYKTGKLAKKGHSQAMCVTYQHQIFTCLWCPNWSGGS